MIDLKPDQNISAFRSDLRRDLDGYLELESQRFEREDCLKVDLHCHDHNSDVPDELWGRILGLPETWLKTKNLVKCLEQNQCDVVTITNHNNARSCWDLLDKGHDVLVGAEFTCHFPEYELFVHVLAYGFDPAQEVVLNKKRADIYDFLRYATEQDIPVILPHPLYFYSRKPMMEPALFEKMAVMFQRFEVLNGQRDRWQSVLTLNWTQGLTAEKIDQYARKHQLNPQDFGVNPERPKILTGGSDDHMGIFAGQCGSYLHVPDLKQRLKTTRYSELALEAIKKGNMAPFGHVAENQKLNIALLDYSSQVATRIKDPGLLRLLFHRGTVSDKVFCFTVGNLLLEMQKHKNTQKFFNFIHDALQGKKPNKLIKWKIKKDYRFCIETLEQIADSKRHSPEKFISTVNEAIPNLVTQLFLLMIKRIKESSLVGEGNRLESFTTEEIIRKFEVPAQLTALMLANTGKKKSKQDMSCFNVRDLLDNLTFPALVSVILLGTTMGSTRLLYQNRRFLNEFAGHIGASHHPRRALYLTDTLRDKNGVSSSLSGKLREIQGADMPIDFLICHSDAQEEPHLHVVKPLDSFTIPDFGEQEFRIPDLLQVSRIFYEGGYDRVICSTEGPMAAVALFLKHMFNVPSYFFMHTDWLEFIKDTTDLNHHERDRIRRLLRVFYKQFAGVFVLNEDHRDWLTGHEMTLAEEQVFMTAHHTEPHDPSIRKIKKQDLFEDANDNTPVLLYAGRLSKEKGIFDLPEIYDRIKSRLPDVRLVVAGSGPAQEELQQRLPDALFTGWVDKNRMKQFYASLDIKLFPTRFDTFGNVILEAMTYGMPVISYNCKGPKSIIENNINGFLVETKEQMADRVLEYLSNGELREKMARQTVSRTRSYQAEPIMNRFLIDLGLADETAIFPIDNKTPVMPALSVA